MATGQPSPKRGLFGVLKMRSVQPLPRLDGPPPGQEERETPRARRWQDSTAKSNSRTMPPPPPPPFNVQSTSSTKAPQAAKGVTATTLQWPTTGAKGRLDQPAGAGPPPPIASDDDITDPDDDIVDPDEDIVGLPLPPSAQPERRHRHTAEAAQVPSAAASAGCSATAAGRDPQPIGFWVPQLPQASKLAPMGPLPVPRSKAKTGARQPSLRLKKAT
ncbi:hypothetical protein JCM8115_002007 [Rhodotorula mucilaginosa]